MTVSSILDSAASALQRLVSAKTEASRAAIMPPTDEADDSTALRTSCMALLAFAILPIPSSNPTWIASTFVLASLASTTIECAACVSRLTSEAAVETVSLSERTRSATERTTAIVS